MPAPSPAVRRRFSATSSRGEYSACPERLCPVTVDHRSRCIVAPYSAPHQVRNQRAELSGFDRIVAVEAAREQRPGGQLQCDVVIDAWADLISALSALE